MPTEFNVKTVGGGEGLTLWCTETDSTNTIKEVGVFNASSTGTMLLRRVLPTSVVMVGSTNLYMIEVEVRTDDI